MATTRKLRMKFTALNGDPMTISFSYCKPAAQLEAADVQALQQGIIANGIIFKTVPAIAGDIDIVETTTTPYTIA